MCFSDSFRISYFKVQMLFCLLEIVSGVITIGYSFSLEACKFSWYSLVIHNILSPQVVNSLLLSYIRKWKISIFQSVPFSHRLLFRFHYFFYLILWAIMFNSEFSDLSMSITICFTVSSIDNFSLHLSVNRILLPHISRPPGKIQRIISNIIGLDLASRF